MRTKEEIQTEFNKTALDLGQFLINAFINNKPIMEMKDKIISLQDEWQALIKHEEEFQAFLKDKQNSGEKS